MHNGKYQCYMAASYTYYHQLLPPNCSTRAILNSLTLNEKCLRTFWKKVRRMDHQQKNDKTERTRGLGRKTREEIGRGNQLFGLDFTSAKCGFTKINSSAQIRIRLYTMNETVCFHTERDRQRVQVHLCVCVYACMHECK